MSFLEFSITKEPPIVPTGIERTYFRGNLTLEIADVSLPSEIVVDKFFGTDSIMEHNKNTPLTELNRAIELIASDRIQDYTFNPSYYQAFKLLRREGPITGFSELIYTYQLTHDQMKNIEEGLLSDSALFEIRGLQERFKSLIGKRRQEPLPLEFVIRGEVGNVMCVVSRALSTGKAWGISGLLDMELNYLTSVFSASRHWLTGTESSDKAATFITYWEGLPLEERAGDFLKNLGEVTHGKVVLSGNS